MIGESRSSGSSWSSPLRWAGGTAAKVLLGVDAALGALWFVVVMLAAGRGFDLLGLGLAISFSLLPDLDFLPYLVLRKRLRRPSHRRIGHHPLILIPAALVAGGAVNAQVYGGARPELMILCGGAVLLHLIHDSVGPQGLHWLSPFSWRHVRLHRGLPREVSEAELDAFYASKSRRRSIADEFDHRLPPIETSHLALWLVSAVAVGVFAVLTT